MSKDFLIRIVVGAFWYSCSRFYTSLDKNGVAGHRGFSATVVDIAGLVI